MALAVEVSVNGTTEPSGRYVTWSPAPCSIRVVDADGATGPIAVRLRTRPGLGGKLAFRTAPDQPPTDQLSLDLAPDGTATDLFVSGLFGAPSRRDRDARLQVRLGTGTHVIADVPMMVRIRKNAETLVASERSRFLRALARLNDHGQGPFRAFRATHTDDTSDEAHGEDAFLPWHRGYVLDLERELQRIDPSVTLPYWRFDRPSPKVFARSFLGVANPLTGQTEFSPSNPLVTWTTDGLVGIVRRPWFDPALSPAFNAAGRLVSDETVTTGSAAAYRSLRLVLEQNPHGRAHVSFQGSISQIGTAARDPLFFLLHCNVDRLWAKWQWLQHRFLPTTDATYHFRAAAGTPGAARIGHNALDTMWPWNNDTTGIRPPTAPRTPFPMGVVEAPDAAPTVGAMIDYQGHADPTSHLGFDYDDVPYEP